LSSDVELTNVSKWFGGHLAVDDVSCAVASGSFFSLLGPSGCGKSTTLRMISGLEWPDSGTLRIAGQDMRSVPANRRPTNMVFQRWALFPHMTVFDNVAFGLTVDRVPAAEIKRRVGEALDLVSLGSFGARKPGQLSGGQMQRVALARALVKRPKVLLLDEPLGALDLKLRTQMQLELKRIQREVGTTFIYVTHDQGEALTMSDSIAVMNLGRIEQLGSPQEIYDRPATRFVAGFIGNANIFPVAVEGIAGAGDEALARVRAGSLVFTAAVGQAPAGGTGAVAIRHERIRLGEAARGLASPDAAAARALIKDVIFSGSAVTYALAVEGAGIELLAEAGHDGASRPLPAGATVDIGWDARAPRLFAAE
jgi:spermidine/putrescine transport system ATP-binding protein